MPHCTPTSGSTCAHPPPPQPFFLSLESRDVGRRKRLPAAAAHLPLLPALHLLISVYLLRSWTRTAMILLVQLLLFLLLLLLLFFLLLLLLLVLILLLLLLFLLLI